MLSTWFRNLPVKRKIFGVVGYFSLMLIAMLTMAIRDVRAAQLRTRTMYQQNLLATAELMAVRVCSLRAVGFVYNIARASSPEQAAQYEEGMNQMDKAYDQAWERYQKTWSTEVERTVGPQYHDLSLEQRRVRTEVLLPLLRQGDPAKFKQTVGGLMDPLDAKLGPLGGKLVKANADQAAGDLETGNSQYLRGMTAGISFSVVAILVGSFLGMVLVKGIHGPLMAFGQVLGAVTQGDLTVQANLNRKDEFGQMGQNLNSMVADLRKVLLGVRGSVEGVASGAVQLSASAEEMAATSSGISRTSERLRSGNERMAAAVTELSASIDGVN
jgi:methyl-accepting chemotaxis protein